MRLFVHSVIYLLFTAGMVFAADQRNTATVENIQRIVIKYLPFIQANSKTWRFGERAGTPRLNVQDLTLPEIVVVDTQDALNRLYLRYATESELEGLDPDGNIPRIAAFYDPDSSTMFFHGEMDITDPYNISTVIHETIHHVQYANGLDALVECESRLEDAAYGIQLEYLRSVGYDNKQRITGLKWNRVLYSSCRKSR